MFLLPSAVFGAYVLYAKINTDTTATIAIRVKNKFFFFILFFLSELNVFPEIKGKTAFIKNKTSYPWARGYNDITDLESVAETPDSGFIM